MEAQKFRSEFARRYVKVGLKQGKQESLDTLRLQVLQAAEAKCGHLSPDIRAIIESAHSFEVLASILFRLGAATDPDSARSAITAAVSSPS